MLWAAIINLTGVSLWDETSLPSLRCVLLYLIILIDIYCDHGYYYTYGLFYEEIMEVTFWQRLFYNIVFICKSYTEFVYLYGILLGYMRNMTDGIHYVYYIFVLWDEFKVCYVSLWWRGDNLYWQMVSWRNQVSTSGMTIKALLSLRPSQENQADLPSQ